MPALKNQRVVHEAKIGKSPLALFKRAPLLLLFPMETQKAILRKEIVNETVKIDVGSVTVTSDGAVVTLRDDINRSIVEQLR